MVVIASESLFKKRRYVWHSISNIFIISTSNMGWLRVSLKQSFANFKKIVCPKNVWMWHCLSAFVKGYCEGGQFQLSHNLPTIEGIELCCNNSQIFPKRDCCSVMLVAILRYAFSNCLATLTILCISLHLGFLARMSLTKNHSSI